MNVKKIVSTLHNLALQVKHSVHHETKERAAALKNEKVFLVGDVGRRPEHGLYRRRQPLYSL